MGKGIAAGYLMCFLHLATQYSMVVILCTVLFRSPYPAGIEYHSYCSTYIVQVSQDLKGLSQPTRWEWPKSCIVVEGKLTVNSFFFLASKVRILSILNGNQQNSVVDPWNFQTDPHPWIRSTLAKKNMDSTDLDPAPEHWNKVSIELQAKF